MLTPISHDLKTPLSAVMRAADTLRDYGPAMDEGDRAMLLTTVIDEGERLNRFIANLPDMTRIGSGALRPNLALEDVSDVVGSALHRAEKITAGHVVITDLAADLPMVLIDPVLFEQVLFNLLDNASKYSPPGSTVLIRARDDQRAVILQVLDSGPGLPEADLECVFDSLYRVLKGDHARVGTGLGLSICCGFIEATVGSIVAENRSDAPGAVLTIRLPIPAQEPRRTASKMEPPG